MVVFGDQLITLKKLSLINNNNYPLGNTDLLIVVEMAAVLVTLSSMERPVKHEHVDFNVLRHSFKDYGHSQKVLVSILSRVSKLDRSTVVSDAMHQERAIMSL